MYTHAEIEDLLDQCLQEVLAGRWSVDDCLRRNPQAAPQLAPLLRAALRLRNTPRPPQLSVEMRHAIERQLLIETTPLSHRVSRTERISARAR